MAAERTPSRRKQCIFRKAFQRFPFGKCERKTRSNGSYDPPQQTAEKWSPTDQVVSSLSKPPMLPLAIMDSEGHNRTLIPHAADPMQNSHRMFDSNGVQPGFSMPSLPLDGHHSDSMQFSHNRGGKEGLVSEFPPLSPAEDEDPLSVALPPSPSISSMETDVEVDPETGERAMD
ncbi:Hypothetical predicted protein [Pelobates cultripes]|uniref:Uncharacterized protein n=1 Tax=Pelobates cultripes TaxID=61616 RepID=A0AAD1THA3_PELCU|nr:Hypothetical predicted protein [Pelobates cultripes]